MKILDAITVGAASLVAASMMSGALTRAEAAGKWQTLFDGKSLNAWRGYQNAPVPSGWKIEGGALVKDTPVADIVTKDEFGDFELQLEWKIGEAGNSGVFYR